MDYEKLFYRINYPCGENHDASRETDVDFISRNKEAVKNACERKDRRKTLKESIMKRFMRRRNHRLSDYNILSITVPSITGKDVWVLFDYDEDMPDTSSVKFAGNSLQECLDWWKEDCQDDYALPADYKVPSFDSLNGKGTDFIYKGCGFGIRIKLLKLIK